MELAVAFCGAPSVKVEHEDSAMSFKDDFA